MTKKENIDQYKDEPYITVTPTIPGERDNPVISLPKREWDHFVEIAKTRGLTPNKLFLQGLSKYGINNLFDGIFKEEVK